MMVYDSKQVDVDREKTMEKLLSCGFRNKAVNWIMLSITNYIAQYSMIKESIGYNSINKKALHMDIDIN